MIEAELRVARASCCVVGCGPAGATLGLLLAAAGVDVVVLDKSQPSCAADSLAGVVAQEGARYPNFTLRTGAEVVELVERGDKIAGVRYLAADGVHEVQATLTVAADGRHSVLRRLAGLPVTDLDGPMDVVWYRAPAGGPAPVFRLGPRPLGEPITEVSGLKDAGFVRTRPSRLRRWYLDGLLCIGDAAHAVSPVALVSAHLAVEDAVAAAEVLAEPLRRGVVRECDLARVQWRRRLPARFAQVVASIVQRQLLAAVLSRGTGVRLPAPLRMALRLPFLRHFVPRFTSAR